MLERIPQARALMEKWSPLLDHKNLPKITDCFGRVDRHRTACTAVLLENTHQALSEAAPPNSLSHPTALGYAGGNGLAGYDPILISMVRRAMPNLIAYDIAGVQPMTGPVGLIFCYRAKYVGGATGRQGSGPEAFFNEPLVQYSGATGSNGLSMGSATAYPNEADPLAGNAFGAAGGTYHAGTTAYGNAPGVSRELLEDLGTSAPFREMTFTIDKTSVTAVGRALKAEWTHELAQDLRAIHGLEAEQELANELSSEIMAEINREIIRDVYRGAKLGAQHTDLAWYGNTSADFGATLGGVYDMVADSDGRWSAERWRGLMFQIEREANWISKDTRRGKGNFIICSADVASALALGQFLNLAPALNQNMEVDDTGNLFAGVLNGKMKVFIDPFSGPAVSSGAQNFCLVGYRGSSPMDAGMFYCPYVPLQLHRAQNETTFEPKIAFKTRYGLVNNPFVSVAASDGSFDANKADPKNPAAIRANMYFRIFRIKNLHGNTA